MDYTNIINADMINMLITVASVIMALIAGLVFITNIVVQVIKSAFIKLPTNILAFIVAMAVTLLVFFAVCEILALTVTWYMVAAAVALGVFVAYAAMFGFDKFREALEQITKYKN